MSFIKISKMYFYDVRQRAFACKDYGFTDYLLFLSVTIIAIAMTIVSHT